MNITPAHSKTSRNESHKYVRGNSWTTFGIAYIHIAKYLISTRHFRTVCWGHCTHPAPKGLRGGGGALPASALLRPVVTLVNTSVRPRVVQPAAKIRSGDRTTHGRRCLDSAVPTRVLTLTIANLPAFISSSFLRRCRMLFEGQAQYRIWKQVSCASSPPDSICHSHIAVHAIEIYWMHQNYTVHMPYSPQNYSAFPHPIRSCLHFRILVLGWFGQINVRNASLHKFTVC